MEGKDKRKGERAKICHRTGQPIMTGWGISEGRPPLTTDPENPFKPFGRYVMEDGDERRGRRR